MKKLLTYLSATFLFAGITSYSDAQQSLSTSAALLFKGITSKTTLQEKNEVALKSKLILSKDKKQFSADGTTDIPYEVHVYPMDLNNDGKEEIGILEYSSYFGGTGAKFTLLIKDASGKYQVAVQQIGMPAILSSKPNTYPDLMLGGPGFEQPVYRYNGKTYTYHRKVSDQVKTSDIETISKAYTSRIH
jgi:hypothetical protein